MALQRYPKLPPFPYGCRNCTIARFQPMDGAPYGGIWICREHNIVVQDFSQCPLVDASFDAEWKLREKYNFTQG